LAHTKASAEPGLDADATQAGHPDSAEAAKESVQAAQQTSLGTPWRQTSRPRQPASEPFDHRVSRKLARGRFVIDASLDLHGLRQRDAHVALKRFLLAAQASGHRYVLIITGKGGPIPAADGEEGWLRQNEGRGVLKRMVPQWLSEPDFKPLIVSFTHAAQ